ncbi:MAG: hypothetical protein EOO09_06450 [Chitinophagaceae bacterium]|nr:MAG: hypothetical protein EOO09_06450 [Chitinophagaceae bacterium]
MLVLLRNEFMSQQALDYEVQCLHHLLRSAESDEKFCVAHELVERNRITSKYRKLLRVVGTKELKPFQFLLNKN